MAIDRWVGRSVGEWTFRSYGNTKSKQLNEKVGG